MASIAGCATGPAAPTVDAPWTLDQALISRLESKIVMPRTAKPLKEFTRYYEPGFDHGRRIVFGLLEEGGDKQVHLGHVPIAMDGGCSIIQLTFDVEAEKVSSIACNGLA